MSSRGIAPKAKQWGKCRCGCGKNTKSDLAPGHDAILRRQLVSIARQGVTPFMEQALHDLKMRGWLYAYDPVTYPKPPKAQRTVQPRPYVPPQPTILLRDRLEQLGIYRRGIKVAISTAPAYMAMTDAELMLLALPIEEIIKKQTKGMQGPSPHFIIEDETA